MGAEYAGAGGVGIETGVDDNANGVLEDSEVDREQYVCDLYVVRIAAGTYHTCALLSDGSARCWGWNGAGQLGDGTYDTRPGPVEVRNLTGAADLALGNNHSCSLLTDGTVRCWGLNN